MMASGSAEVRREERRVPSCHDGGCRVDAVTFCDEAVVVLDRCTDGSRDIALRFADRTIEGAWRIEGARRGLVLRNPMAHYVDRNISDMIQRLNRYRSARARPARFRGHRFGLPQLPAHRIAVLEVLRRQEGLPAKAAWDFSSPSAPAFIRCCPISRPVMRTRSSRRTNLNTSDRRYYTKERSLPPVRSRSRTRKRAGPARRPGCAHRATRRSTAAKTPVSPPSYRRAEPRIPLAHHGG